MTRSCPLLIRENPYHDSVEGAYSLVRGLRLRIGDQVAKEALQPHIPRQSTPWRAYAPEAPRPSFGREPTTPDPKLDMFLS